MLIIAEQNIFYDLLFEIFEISIEFTDSEYLKKQTNSIEKPEISRFFLTLKDPLI
jgi:hypothetical protein